MYTQPLSNDEMIERIKSLGGDYDSESNLDLMSQLQACESIVESIPVDPTDEDGKIIQQLKERIADGDGDDNGSVSGTYKRQVNFDLTDSKLQAIAQLNDFIHPMTPRDIEQCLQEIFIEFKTKDGWWLYVGQHWTQRQINWVLRYVLKLHRSGEIRKDPASCFTYFIQHRKKKRRFIDINDSHKQQNI